MNHNRLSHHLVAGLVMLGVGFAGRVADAQETVYLDVDHVASRSLHLPFYAEYRTGKGKGAARLRSLTPRTTWWGVPTPPSLCG